VIISLGDYSDKVPKGGSSLDPVLEPYLRLPESELLGSLGAASDADVHSEPELNHKLSEK
jgi:hypothetical protein